MNLRMDNIRLLKIQWRNHVTMSYWFILALLVVSIAGQATKPSGAAVQLTASPPKLSVLGSESLSITCRPGNLDTKDILVIKIFKDGNTAPLAAISSQHPVTLYDDASSLGAVAKGLVDDKIIPNNYLTLTFQKPTQVQSGKYECEIVYLHLGGNMRTDKGSMYLLMDEDQGALIRNDLKDLREIVNNIGKELLSKDAALKEMEDKYLRQEISLDTVLKQLGSLKKRHVKDMKQMDDKYSSQGKHLNVLLKKFDDLKQQHENETKLFEDELKSKDEKLQNIENQFCTKLNNNSANVELRLDLLGKRVSQAVSSMWDSHGIALTATANRPTFEEGSNDVTITCRPNPLKASTPIKSIRIYKSLHPTQFVYIDDIGFSGTQGLPLVPKVSVTGSLTPNLNGNNENNKRFLTLTFLNISTQESGLYSCKIFYADNSIDKEEITINVSGKSPPKYDIDSLIGRISVVEKSVGKQGGVLKRVEENVEDVFDNLANHSRTMQEQLKRRGQEYKNSTEDIDSTILNLTQQFKNMQFHLNDQDNLIEKRVDNLNTSVTQLEWETKREISSYENKNEDHIKNITTQLIDSLNNLKSDSSSSRNETDDEFKKLREFFTQLVEKDKHELENDISEILKTFTHEIDNEDKKIENSTSEIANLRVTMNTVVSELATNGFKIDDVTTKVSNLKHRLKNISIELKEKDDKIEHGSSEINNLHDNLENVTKNLKTLGFQVKNISSNILVLNTNLNNEILTKGKSIEHLTSDIENLQDNFLNLTADLKTLHLRVGQISLKVIGLNKNLKNGLAKNDNKIQNVSSNIENNIHDHFANVTDELSTIGLQIKYIATKFVYLNNKLITEQQRENNTIHEISSRFIRLQEQLNNVTAKLATKSNSIEVAATIINNLQTHLNNVSNILQGKDNDIDEINLMISKEELKLNNFNQTLNKLTTNLKGMNSVIQNLLSNGNNTPNKQLQNVVEKHEISLQALQALQNKLTTTLKNLENHEKNKFTSLDSKISKLENLYQQDTLNLKTQFKDIVETITNLNKTTNDIISSTSQSSNKGSSNSLCPDGMWTEVDGVCYKAFHLHATTWSKARDFCHSFKGGKLVHILNTKQNEIVRELLLPGRPYFANYWIGLNDIATDGTYVFDGRNDVTSYVHWKPHEPNGGKGQNCVEMIAGTGYWSTDQCARKFNFVCQVE